MDGWAVVGQLLHLTNRSPLLFSPFLNLALSGGVGVGRRLFMFFFFSYIASSLAVWTQSGGRGWPFFMPAY